MDIYDLFKSAETFGVRLEAMLSELGILESCRVLHMDHIGIRFRNESDVEELYEFLVHVGEDISTAVVNGRLIHLIQLLEPLQVGSWSTSCVELPYPKSGSVHVDGWEHVEFVLPGEHPDMGGLQLDFAAEFPSLFGPSVGKYKRKDSQPHADDDQLDNPTIAITAADVTAKFHPRPIQEVTGYTKPSR
jgi:predicted metalloenzyme YecM